jgi:hypothetical protein
VARSELQRLQGDIAAWREGRQIANPVKLNTLAYEILREVPWRHLGISEWTWNRFITQETVILEGTKPARAPHLVIPNEEWAGQGLEAYAALKIAENNPGSSAEEAYLRRYAALIRRLGRLLEAHVRRRLPTQPDGEPWAIDATAVQILLVRCWLRGTVSPLAPTWEQWRNLITDEDEATSSPQDRIDSWNAIVNRTKDSHRKFRDILRQLVTLPQGDQSRQALSDTGVVASAISSLQVAMQLAPFPPPTEITGQQLSELALLAENAAFVKEKRLSRIPLWEVERLKGLAQAVDGMVRGLSLREHINRVDQPLPK